MEIKLLIIRFHFKNVSTIIPLPNHLGGLLNKNIGVLVRRMTSRCVITHAWLCACAWLADPYPGAPRAANGDTLFYQ